MNDDFDLDTSWTDEERAQFAALRRDAATDTHQETDTVAALYRRGLLQHRPVARRGRVLRWGLGIAAGLVLFAGGTVYGRTLGRRDVTTDSPSFDVQRAGSAYVEALVRLSQAGSVRGIDVAAGLEAGATTLRAAATTVAQRNPGDSVARKIASKLNDPLTSTPEHGNAVIWF